MANHNHCVQPQVLLVEEVRRQPAEIAFGNSAMIHWPFLRLPKSQLPLHCLTRPFFVNPEVWNQEKGEQQGQWNNRQLGKEKSRRGQTVEEEIHPREGMKENVIRVKRNPEAKTRQVHLCIYLITY
jgi:hypothetical protein